MSYKNKNDYINNLLKEETKKIIKENIIIEERQSSKEKFVFVATKYDHISELLKEEVIEEEKINYICIKEEKKIKNVIDISSWQGDIDFEKVKESGKVDGVIVRIGYGTTLNDNPVLDNKFERNIKELIRLNIPFGIYIFGYAQNINASNIEADFVMNTLEKYNIDKNTYIWYDAELQTFQNTFYTSIMYKTVIDNFVSRLNNNGYSNVGLYGNLYMLTDGSLSFEHNYPVWVAQYNDTCQYDKEYLGWQYTSDGSIPGIEGRVDLNYFY